MVAKVLVELSTRTVDKTFDYLVPEKFLSSIQVGCRVIVPFGKQKLEGFVLELTDKQEKEELKEIIDVSYEVVLNQELLNLGKWLQKETLATLISCYQVMLPKALKADKDVNMKIQYDSFLVLGDVPFDLDTGNSTQKEIVLQVEKLGKVSKKDLNVISSSSVKTLVKRGVLQEVLEERYRLQDEVEMATAHPLTWEQKRVVETVLSKKDEFIPYLLHGVTGSGKTEVYMEIISRQLEEGKTAIVLVPEISLTPQIVKRFKGRFGPTVAILHSRLSEGEKYDEYRKIARGEVSIVIGARSAIFAPLSRIGAIIIDEEHTSSYHQERDPRYRAIDVAMKRGKTHHCPVILGSATPTLESYARAEKGVYHLLELPHRVNNRSLPSISVVDLNQEKKNGTIYFSKTLLDKIKERLEKQEQILLLLNRRGYASYITCSNCGYVYKCPNCDITLTYHKTNQMLRCHYCGYATKKDTICPSCKEDAIKEFGLGTEKVEEELKKLFEGVRVVRMDFDTTSKKGAHAKILEDFGEGKYDILLGTQMIAKGLDFPNVTLVGVISADTSLNIPDFRSSEVTFQLLDQVAGRSGRGEKEGEVVIQTFNPDHYAIMYAKNHDYIGFYREEMKIRKMLKYSPYYYMALIKISSRDYEVASRESNLVASVLKKKLTSSILLGPTTASMFRVNNIYHFQIIIKYKKEEHLYPTLESMLKYYESNRNVMVAIDFNPTSFL